MKKIIALVLAVILCLSLSACGKSEAVKNVEGMIDALGEITLESIDAIRAAEDAFNALIPEEQEKVKNHEILTTARDRYYELALVGNWHDTFIWMDVETNYERPPYLVLNADMTGIEYGDGGIEDAITWSVKNRNLEFQFESGNTLSFPIIDEQDRIVLDGFSTLLKEDEYFAYINDIFLIVDMAEVDPSEYFTPEICDYGYRNEWGDLTGTHYVNIILTSLLYEEGWLYMDSSDDFAVEIVYPEFNVYHEYSENENEYSYTDTKEAGCYTYTYCPFGFWNNDFKIGYYDEQSSWNCDLDVNQCTFGRAKGKIYFINSDYVSEVKCADNGSSRVLVTAFPGSEEVYSGMWDDQTKF